MKLFRYQKIDDKSRRAITHNELYFSSPKDFNDPFDCRVDFNVDSFFSKNLVKQYLEKAQRNTDKPIDFALAISDKEELKRNIKRLSRLDLQPELEKNIGILSLSEKNDDILMWSHYANKHTGFCLEFDRSALCKWRYCKPVVYTKKLLTFREFCNALSELNHNNLEASISAYVMRKAIHWEYEKEWRVIINVIQAGSRTLIYPQDILTGVIFGCRMSDYDKTYLKNRLESDGRKIKIYKANEKQNRFELEIKEITD